MKHLGNGLQLVYSDNHIVVVCKPKGMLSQPTKYCSLSAETLVKNWIKKEKQKPGNVFLHAVHRLDKPVSGLLLFAKTSKALRRLNQQMRDKQIHKRYRAILENDLKQSSATLALNLKKSAFKTSVNKEGKHAILEYVVVSRNPTTVEVHLITGRYHQIRASFAHINNPIQGDTKYGSKHEGELSLHHYQMSFIHPITKKQIVFTS